MADLDIDALILSEHEAFRRAFAALEGLADPDELGRRWEELSAQLEVHAAGEEEILYPELLQEVDDSVGDTKHALKDHNEIREATSAVDEHELGSDAWWEAFRAAREATVEHLAEEEQDVLPPFRENVDATVRADLGERWLEFQSRHVKAKGLSGDEVDPDAYVEENTA